MKQEIFNNLFTVNEQTPVEEIIRDIRETKKPDSAFFAVDLGDVVYKYNQWKVELPRVKPFYAVKCNDTEGFLKVLAGLGFGFDCASKVEIEKILSLSVDKSRIIYANPCKTNSHIRFAAKVGVDLMTFDNVVELHKIHKLYPSARLVIRIKADATKSQCTNFGVKFGVDPEQAHHLLQVAQELDLNVVGVSFHVGSGCEDPCAFSRAVHAAKNVFKLGLEMGFPMEIMDVGGGFPGTDDAPVTFPEIAKDLRDALDACFPKGSSVQIIGEPGRYFAASAFTLSTAVIGKRTVKDEGFMYYLNDGLYGSFNCIMYDHATVTASALKKAEAHCSSLWGPTCDSLDKIVERCHLPELDVGDTVYFNNMGAYTISASTTFNGFPKPTVFYYASLSVWAILMSLGIPSLSSMGEEEIKLNDPLSPSMEQLEQWRKETEQLEQIREQCDTLVLEEDRPLDDTYALVAALL